MRKAHGLLIGCTIALVLSGCSDDPYAALRTKVERADKLASICLRDVQHVPFEHSANCIAANRYFWDRAARSAPEMRACFEQESLACQKIGDRESDSLGRIHNAIAQSLFRFGKPILVLREEREGTHQLLQSGFNFYRSMPDLDEAFAECLAEHPDPPTSSSGALPQNLDGKPVISMPSVKNHNCIPEGVDLFGFSKLP